MSHTPARWTTFTPAIAERVWRLVAQAALLPDVRAEVEANHDQNRWWPTTVLDWRLRMAVAGWSTRISYNMITTYAQVVTEADNVGFDQLAAYDDDKLLTLVAPLGLPQSRIRYFRSLVRFLDERGGQVRDLLVMSTDELIERFAGSVEQAGYKVAQCAVLYSRGYHSGIIPVDSGMLTRLAPCLGMQFGSDARAHEAMRHILEACVATDAVRYRELATTLNYDVDIPGDAAPTWWVHLVLIYFKRLYCNRPHPRLCPRRPLCAAVVDCGCAAVR